MQKPRKLLRIGISIGDVNGIGPELIIRAFQEQKLKELCTPIIYGSARVLNIYRKILSVDRFSYNVVQEPGQAQPRKISVIDCIRNIDRVEVGKPTKDGGRAAYDALSTAVKDLKAGTIDALVTMPIDKHTIQGEDFDFPGHTEYLARTFEVEDNLMLMVSEDLRVGVVTGHVPLKDVSKSLTLPLIESKIKLMHESLKQDFQIAKPRIAVLGLNPHAGDNGLLGKEEREKIQKAIDSAQKNKMLVMGPYSADGFFGAGTFRNFDGVLAMYHDQGLIPFKLMAGFRGVNFTAGLPAVRTSPDHGLAYNLAGKSEASTLSFKHAIYAAIDIVRRRREHLAIEEDSLWNKKREGGLEKARPPKRDNRKQRQQPRNERNERKDQKREAPKKDAPATTAVATPPVVRDETGSSGESE